ncbi:class F sortase [Streptomyces lunaelactis]|uniref:class F sortase n=1 Tax=Streptomyces lunaelactis TaxID=1535768 RepID=UPI00158575CA|nr:class F sortase [Streptomyces lunaelactis]NUK07593.1 class F sortase [Streptomyces lunaelactis]NUL09149.1 class F sortase [Streptomyces lunaelactis]NUL21386.1 class F sortase [Streptomyces lunaelactis]
MSSAERPAGSGRLLTGVAWALLLLGLWLWGRGVASGSGGSSAPTTGDVAAVGRPLGIPLPPAHDPMGPARPDEVDIPSIGITAPVVPRGLDATGAIDPPPYETPHTVGWYDSGTQPGAVGTALLVGHVDTETKPAVFYGLSAAHPGEKVRVTRADGTVAEFTIDDVQVFGRDRFDPRKVYGPRKDGRAELRLITCGGTFDRATRTYDANVVVSAYLTAVVKK